MLRDIGQASRVEMERDDKDAEARSNSLILAIMFWILLALSQVFLWCVILPLVIVWVTDDLSSSGLEQKWTGGPQTFNWHPLLTIIAFIIVGGEGTLVFRALSRIGVSSKNAQKFVHVFLMAISCILIGVALGAIFYNQETLKYANLKTLHSKLGLAAAVHFFVQFLLGLIFYAFPCMPKSARRYMMPYHRFAGKAVIVLAAMAILTGLQEQLGWETEKPDTASAQRTGQGIGLAIVYTVMIILFLLGRDEYRRYQEPKRTKSPKDLSQKSLLEE